ncbi:EF-hand calcium-binding domain-containing protein 7-like isoform X2 [Haliotis rubra]|uniref:EF-hand calcium-binding domain-containing protein 7-like isoform X2 n=1 Tax=Haliotis rubra TaxID=36100 RepID=UPI001EE5CEC1|nr:EF-hand calcium-binding domain-containing protein 7-like isoform X2 [Haliotis rubra]
MSRRLSRPSSAASHRSSGSSGYDSEFKTECKAAYLSIYDDLKDVISSEYDLSAVLQQSGRNPTKKTLAKYWTDDTDYLTFDDFVNICRREHATTTDDLMKAFRKIDINGDGYISLDELFRMLTTRGEKMTRDEVQRMIDEVDENRDGRLDYEERKLYYSEFCNMMMSTADECKKMSLKMMDKKERKKRRTSNTPRRGDDENIHGSRTSLRSNSSVKPPTVKADSQLSVRSSRASRYEIEEDIQDDLDIKEDIMLSSRSSVTRSPRKLQPQEKPGSLLSLRSNRNPHTEEAEGQGLSHSLRSVGRTGSKSSLISIDDMPKPSPRVKKDKVRTPVGSRSAKVSEPSNLRDWTHTSSKGCFFIDADEGGQIISHQYTLDLADDTNVFITMQPNRIGDAGFTDDGPVDTAVYVLREGSSSHKVVTFTEQRDSKGRYCVRCDLPAGKYKLVPFTTGCRLYERSSGRETKEVKLIKQDKDDKIVLSKQFKKALEDIFDMADLDGNGLLSREDFNWYNIRTSGEEVADDEWDVVEGNIELERGEITKTGFIHLNQMEAEDNDGDTDDLWVTLTSMGFNKSLVLTQACPFKLDVYTEDCRDASLEVVGLETQAVMEDAVCDTVIAKSEASKVKGMKDLSVYTYIGDARATVLVENQSYSKIRIQLDCSRSKNVVSNQRDLNYTLTVPSNTTMIGHHLIPRDEKAEWIVRCQEIIIR